MRKYLIGLLSVLSIAAVTVPMWRCDDARAQQRRTSTSTAQSGEDRSSDAKTIAVLGSSVARGWVTSYAARQDLLNGYAFRLERLLKPRGWKVVNISNPGDNTKDVLARIERDLLPLRPQVVIIGLSMSNEGLENTTDVETVFESYRSGLKKIIQVCRKNGTSPVVGLCYPNDNYDARHYACIKRMNLLLNTWDVPSINFLGPVDNGSGGWVEGYTFDLDHPDDVGHEEMFYAIVPSLFDALQEGTPPPPIAKSVGHVSVGDERVGVPISFVPEDVMHSFTLAFEMRASSEGPVAGLNCGESRPSVEITADGRLQYVSSAGETLTSEVSVTDANWHDVTLCHRHLLSETELFLDGTAVGTTTERLVPRQFVIGANGSVTPTVKPASADYRRLLVYRSPLNSDEVGALHAGSAPRASLEVYAPLSNERLDERKALVNLAQSRSKVVAYPGDVKDEVARLESRIEQSRKAPRYVDPNEKTPVDIDPSVFDAYVGEYSIDASLTLIITKEKGRLLLSPNRRGKTQLYPESETRFFTRIMGPKIGVEFRKNRSGEVTGLMFVQDGMKIPAKRVADGG